MYDSGAQAYLSLQDYCIILDRHSANRPPLLKDTLVQSFHLIAVVAADAQHSIAQHNTGQHISASIPSAHLHPLTHASDTRPTPARTSDTSGKLGKAYSLSCEAYLVNPVRAVSKNKVQGPAGRLRSALTPGSKRKQRILHGEHCRQESRDRCVKFYAEPWNATGDLLEAACVPHEAPICGGCHIAERVAVLSRPHDCRPGRFAV